MYEEIAGAGDGDQNRDSSLKILQISGIRRNQRDEDLHQSGVFF